MDKQQVLSFIKGQIEAGKIAPSDLSEFLDESPSISSQQTTPVTTSKGEHKSLKITNILYGIGAIIAVVGVLVFIFQNWDLLGMFGHIAITLGLSFVTYVSAFLLRSPDQSKLSQTLFTISAALAPVGVGVLLNEFHIDITTNINLFMALGLFVIYGVALWVRKENILTFITILFGTWLYYSIIIKIFDVSIWEMDNLFKYATMILGLSYIFMGYWYDTKDVSTDISLRKEKTAIRSLLYGLGTLAVLVTGSSFDGIFNVLFILVLFGFFYLSVFVHSRAMLVFSAIFLIVHIFRMTGLYFVNSIGWPIALILSGFMIIGVGYASYSVSKKYIN